MGALAVHFPHESSATQATVETMCRAAPHRGQMLDATVHGRCALAVSALDELPDASLWRGAARSAVFVGSLDNDAELRARLADAGDGAARSPAELLARLHEREGVAGIARLRGVFAAVVTDGEHVWAFRDQLGYEPLYYRVDDRGLTIATEAKQVVAGAQIPFEPDLEVVRSIFFRTYDDRTHCALKGVSRLPKATVLASTDGAVRLDRYWEPHRLLETARYTEAELAERFAELLEQAVGRCLTGADVVLLSGGIDSPAIAGFAAPLYPATFGTPLRALSAVYPRQPSVDERAYVELVAERLGLVLTTYEQRANALDDLERWVALADTPYPAASLAQYEESFLLARASGCRTLLSGEHAELVFNMHQHLLGYLITHGRIAGVVAQLRSRHAAGASVTRLASQMVRSLAPAAYLARRRLRVSRSPAWVTSRESDLDAASAMSGPRRRWRRQQLGGFEGPGVSVEASAVCQAVSGVRVRRPWIDVDLWEFFLSLPAEQKFPNHYDKGLVRNLLHGRVPDEILERRDKTSFNEAHLQRLDYEILRRFLVEPKHRLPGVDYAQLADVLQRERMDIVDYNWAKNLATAHAFLAQW